MLAFCGIDCSNCPVYRATMTNDEILKRETAEKWGRELDDCMRFFRMNFPALTGERR